MSDDWNDRMRDDEQAFAGELQRINDEHEEKVRQIDRRIAILKMLALFFGAVSLLIDAVLLLWRAL